MKRFYSIILLLVLSIFSYGQADYYSAPLKIPLYLSGSFAELRSNHFHSGVDIKTQGVKGLPVYSVADGFISRIVVSPTGFGLALYINHSNGTTSVYGHLSEFKKEISEFVKNRQYQKKSFRVDLYISEGMFPVKKGEFIGKSGNSGSSGGPHLHFEIRDTDTQKPLNPLNYNIRVKDNIPPKIYSLMITPLNVFAHVDYQTKKKIFSVDKSEGNYYLKDDFVVPVYGEIGFAIRANDYFCGSKNPCGVYSVKMLWDGELYYSYKMDKFAFSETKYINSHIDYEEYINNKRRYQKSWIEPGNKLSIYDYVRNAGIVNANDGNIHHVRFEVEDLSGNISFLDFNVESKVFNIEREKDEYEQLMKFDEQGRYINNDVRVEFKKGTFYNDIKFRYMRMPSSEKFYSDIHIINRNTVPMNKCGRLSIFTGKLSGKIRDKALLVKVDTITNKIYGVGGKYDNEWVTGAICSFGNYAVAVDTVPPEIVPLSIKNNVITESSRIRFCISDDLSGIKSYQATLDNKWALFEYDAKTGIIVHYFDAKRFNLKKRHRFELKVIDNKGNESKFESSFWK